MKSPDLRTYTIQEVSRLINVPTGTIKRWEKDLGTLIHIPRTKQGARLFTEVEITFLRKVKELRDANTSLGKIADVLQKQSGIDLNIEVQEVETSIITVSQPAHIPGTQEPPNLDDFFKIMDVYKENLLGEIKTEIRNGIRKEVLEEVKKEISKSSVQTVKSLSSSIYKLNEQTKTEFQELSNIISESSESSSETIKSLSYNLAHATEHTSKTIDSLSTHIVQASEDTKHEISHLVDSLNKDRELYIETLHEERMHFTKEIRSREAVFQNLVTSFRNTAVGSEGRDNRKWWKFWKFK